MRPLRPICVALGLALVASTVGANEPEPAADAIPFSDKLAACGACHGENGAKPILPEYPILAGQHADYLANSLRGYRDGRRNNAIMASQTQALQLTDDDIEQLAAYFAAQASPLASLRH